MQVGLSLGPSFAELCVSSSFSYRAYLPKENLNACFQKIRDKYPGQKIDRLIVSCRYLEKIFETKLGGSVAQLVTSGFETWPVIRQPISPEYFVTHPARGEPLASQELIFGIPERINFKGEIIKPLDLNALEFIAAKLKMMEIKKVCINLLFSSVNAIHQDQVKSYFLEKGFDIFCAPRPASSRDEVSAWRNNILNACLAGTFLEVLNDIQKATLDLVNPENILFLDAQGGLQQRPLNCLSSIIFGWTAAVTPQRTTLHLGLENWALIYPEITQHWQSPWGSIEILHRKTRPLKNQPTQEIESDFWGELGCGDKNIGYEPGPMTWGRGQKPLLADLLFSQFPAANIESLTSPTGRQRYQANLRVLQRNSNSLHELDFVKFERALFDKVLTEIDLGAADDKIWISGYFAPHLIGELQKRCPRITWQLAENADFMEASHAAHL